VILIVIDMSLCLFRKSLLDKLMVDAKALSNSSVLK
jgi:hypothetical protein